MACNTILIVEDEADLRQTMRDLLEIYGFNVVTASNGKEAIPLLLSKHQTCLVLLDMMMPVMSGGALVEFLEKNHPDVLARIPIVVVSAAADTLSMPVGIAEKMNKPVHIPRLLDLARQYCDASPL